MTLSSDLISQFVKVTNDKKEPKNESTHYGKIVTYNDHEYVQLDGSDVLTPISSTASIKVGERVMVTIKDHTATVTGNISDPSAGTKVVESVEAKADEAIDQISEFEIVITKKIVAAETEIEDLKAENAEINEKLTANQAEIDSLKAKDVEIEGTLTAVDADIDNLEVNKLDVSVAEAEYATIKNLDATNADIHNLEATYGDFEVLTTKRFEAVDTEIKNLDAVYAKIDFANINQAAVEKLFTESGIIEDLVVQEGKITGELVGVTIKGDLIEGGTVIADKLVIKGDNGLYYKLNTDGVSTETEQTEYNSLNGKIIAAKSITASKIAVDDLVAFDATIGGFNITDDAIYSGNKATAESPVKGIYLDNTGQVVFGDESNYLKYYKDENGSWQLEITAKTITFGDSSKSVEEVVQDIQNEMETIKDEVTTNLRIESSRGTVFKNNAVSTVLTAVIYRGSQRITDMITLKSAMGSSAYLQWSWQKFDEENFGTILATDPRISDDGFTFTLSPEDVDTKVTFLCELIT